MVPNVSDSPMLMMYKIPPIVNPYAIVLIITTSLSCHRPYFQFIRHKSPDAAPETEDADEQRNSQKHLPARYVGSKIIADGHIDHAADDGTVKTAGPSDQCGENHFDRPGGIDKNGGYITVVQNRKRAGKGRNRCGNNEGDPFIVE